MRKIIKDIGKYKKFLKENNYDDYIEIRSFTGSSDNYKETHYEISGVNSFICKELKLSNAKYNFKSETFKSNHIGYNYEPAKTFKQIIDDSKEKIKLMKKKDEEYRKFNNYVLDNLDKLKISTEKTDYGNSGASHREVYMIDDFIIKKEDVGWKKAEYEIKVYKKEEYCFCNNSTSLASVFLERLTEFLVLKHYYIKKMEKEN